MGAGRCDGKSGPRASRPFPAQGKDQHHFKAPPDGPLWPGRISSELQRIQLRSRDGCNIWQRGQNAKAESGKWPRSSFGTVCTPDRRPPVRPEATAGRDNRPAHDRLPAAKPGSDSLPASRLRRHRRRNRAARIPVARVLVRRILRKRCHSRPILGNNRQFSSLYISFLSLYIRFGGLYIRFRPWYIQKHGLGIRF
jgi:hypothetical protein